MRIRTIAIIMGALLLVAQMAQTQETSQVERKGFVFGTSLGIAHSNITFPNTSENFTDLALDLKIGYMINPRLALLLTSNVSIYDYSGLGRDRKRDFGVLSPSVKYWLHNRLWILGGIGIGGDNPVFWDIKNPDADSLETQYYSGLGLVASTGYELFQLNNQLIIDIKGRAMYRKLKIQEENNSGFSFGLLLGINFY